MVSTFKADWSMMLSLSELGAAAFTANPAWNGLIQETKALSHGTGADQFDLAYMAERTVLTAANDDLDLAGVLASALGVTVAGVELVGLFLKNMPLPVAGVQGVNTTNLTIGNGSNPIVGFLGGTTPSIGPIRPGGSFHLLCGDPAGLGVITPTTGDILRIANSAGATNKYQIAVLARTA